MNQRNLIACESFDSLSRLRNGPGAQVTNSLFDQMIKEFAKLNLQYYIEEQNYPFQYSELQLEPILFVSYLHSGALPFGQEPAITKARGMPEKTGRIDLWVSHRNTIHLIELKFRRLSWNYRSLNQIQKLWKSANDQIHDRVVQPDIYDNIEKVFKTAMLVVPFYLESKYEDRLELPDSEDVLESAKEVWKYLKPAPDWSSLWTLCEDHARPVVSYGGESIFPGVLILTNSIGPI